LCQIDSQGLCPKREAPSGPPVDVLRQSFGVSNKPARLIHGAQLDNGCDGGPIATTTCQRLRRGTYLAAPLAGATRVQKSVNSMVSKNATTLTIFPSFICRYQV
jgi:hypothetical protein